MAGISSRLSWMKRLVPLTGFESGARRWMNTASRATVVARTRVSREPTLETAGIPQLHRTLQTRTRGAPAETRVAHHSDAVTVDLVVLPSSLSCRSVPGSGEGEPLKAAEPKFSKSALIPALSI